MRRFPAWRRKKGPVAKIQEMQRTSLTRCVEAIESLRKLELRYDELIALNYEIIQAQIKVRKAVLEVEKAILIKSTELEQGTRKISIEAIDKVPRKIIRSAKRTIAKMPTAMCMWAFALASVEYIA